MTERLDPGLAVHLVAELGGRFSTEAGIEVDGGPYEVERWFLAATLFGTRISASIAVRTYGVLDGAGVRTIADAGGRSWAELVALLDEGGYARYDERTARRLRDLADAVAERHPDGIAALGRLVTEPVALTSTLDALPGWGPVTVGAFLRELRGVWPGARPPIDARARRAAVHLGLIDDDRLTIDALRGIADREGLDVRDVEAALVRLALAHERRYTSCAATGACTFLSCRR